MGKIEFMIKVLDIKDQPLKIAKAASEKIYKARGGFHDAFVKQYQTRSPDEWPWEARGPYETIREIEELMDGILALEKERLRKEKALSKEKNI